MTATPPATHRLYQAAFAPHPEQDAAERARHSQVATGSDVLTVLIGTCLVTAPIGLGYGVADRGSAGFWNAVVTGVVIALVAAIRARRPLGAVVLRAAGVALGAWLMLAPAVLGVVAVNRVVAGEVAVGFFALLFAAIGLRASVLGRRIR